MRAVPPCRRWPGNGHRGCRRRRGCRASGPALSGDGVAEHPLGGSYVGAGPRGCGDGHRDVLLQGAVAGGVVGDAVLPAAPEYAAPGAAEDADRVRVVVAAGDARA